MTTFPPATCRSSPSTPPAMHPNHLCYLLDLPGLGESGEAATRVLFSGDHIMGGSTVVIAPPDGDMRTYLDSLERVARIEPPLTVIAPGHGPLLPEPAAVVEGYIAHRLDREASILAALDVRGSAGVDDLVTDVYTDVAPELHPVAQFSVWAHLRKLAGDGLVESDEPDDLGGDLGVPVMMKAPRAPAERRRPT